MTRSRDLRHWTETQVRVPDMTCILTCIHANRARNSVPVQVPAYGFVYTNIRPVHAPDLSVWSRMDHDTKNFQPSVGTAFVEWLCTTLNIRTKKKRPQGSVKTRCFFGTNVFVVVALRCS